MFAPAALEMFEGLGVEPAIYASNVMVMVATEEAVVNSLFVAGTVCGVDGHLSPGLDVDRVLALMQS